MQGERESILWTEAHSEHYGISELCIQLMISC